MTKVIYCLRRREGLSREQFQSYWLDHHGSLVKRLAAATGMVRYVQNHTVASRLGDSLTEARGAAEPYDGVMEGWWDNAQTPDSTRRAEAREAALALLEDEAHFIDLEHSSIFVVEEREIY